MAKLTLTDLGTTLANTAATVINTNDDRIEAAFENTLSRDGTGPNQMEADLDINNNDILNVNALEAQTLTLGGQLVVPADMVDIPAVVMLKTTYDPQNISTDAFQRANHTGPVVWPVTNLTALKGLDTTKFTTAYLKQSGREGTFIWTEGDFSALVTLDTEDAIYVKADTVLASSGAWVRQDALKIDVRWCGAVIDGVAGSTGFTGTDDGLAIQRAIDLGVTLSRPVYVPAGISIINNRGLLPTGRVNIEGEGSAASIWAFTGTFTRTVQTLITAPVDGEDDAINIALKLVSAYSSVKGLALRLDFDGTDDLDYGADIDIGVFVDSVPFVHLDDVRATGYWRQAGCYLDITKNSVSATLDYLRITGSSWFQGFWGLRIEGPEPIIGNPDLLVDDNRGRGGASDIMTQNLRLWGMNHHSNVRYSDTNGGAYRVSGKIYPGTSAINAIQGRRHYGIRFQTPEPYAFYIDAAIREQIFGGFIDRSGGYVKTDGVTGVTDADQTYVTTSRTKQALFMGLDAYRSTNALTAGTYSWLDGSTEGASDLPNFLRGDLTLLGNVPSFFLREEDQGADGKLWKISASGGVLAIQTNTDAGAFGANAILITRSGTGITSVNINGPCILNSSNVTVPNLPTTNPGGTRRLWVDTAASNVVKAT